VVLETLRSSVMVDDRRRGVMDRWEV